MRKSYRSMTRSALFAALICILSPLAIPVGVIPVTLGVFAVLFSAVLLEWKQACAAVGVYLLLGLVGLPVFSAGKGGLGVFFGPTGGYIWTYLPMAALVGWASQTPSAEKRPAACAFAACLLALLLCYACGTLQFMLVADVKLPAALAGCVYPFIPFDLIKCAAAAVLGTRIRSRLLQMQ